MEHLFLSKKESYRISELGFNEPCFAYHLKEELNILDGKNHIFVSVDNHRNSKIKEYEYADIVCAPTYQQAFEYFRDKFLIAAHVTCWKWMDEFRFVVSDGEGTDPFSSKIYNSYEDAQKECVEYINNAIRTDNLKEILKK